MDALGPSGIQITAQISVTQSDDRVVIYFPENRGPVPPCGLLQFYAQDCTDRAKKLWTHLQSRMDLALWQDTTDCLGCEVKRDRANHTISINQSNAVRALTTH